MFETFIEARDFRHAVQVFWQTRKVEVFGSIMERRLKVLRNFVIECCEMSASQLAGRGCKLHLHHELPY